jgi:hypothetical protein
MGDDFHGELDGGGRYPPIAPRMMQLCTADNCCKCRQAK